jgi:hypothetical protein
VKTADGNTGARTSRSVGARFGVVTNIETLNFVQQGSYGHEQENQKQF